MAQPSTGTTPCHVRRSGEIKGQGELVLVGDTLADEWLVRLAPP
jgi:hypothetical protein